MNSDYERGFQAGQLDVASKINLEESKHITPVALDNLIVAATRASAELRHAYKLKQDWNLVARAIEILERAVQGTK